MGSHSFIKLKSGFVKRRSQVEVASFARKPEDFPIGWREGATVRMPTVVLVSLDLDTNQQMLLPLQICITDTHYSVSPEAPAFFLCSTHQSSGGIQLSRKWFDFARFWKQKKKTLNCLNCAFSLIPNWKWSEERWTSTRWINTMGLGRPAFIK